MLAAMLQNNKPHAEDNTQSKAACVYVCVCVYQTYQ